MSVAIVTDSTSDIPGEEAERLGISVVPVIIISHEQSYRDGVDISRSEFYRRMTVSGDIPTTASPSVGAFEDAYDAILRRGVERILSIHPAAALSGIYNSARIAASRFAGRVTVMESGRSRSAPDFRRSPPPKRPRAE
jgi:DegV family protein with EDD domain